MIDLGPNIDPKPFIREELTYREYNLRDLSQLLDLRKQSAIYSVTKNLSQSQIDIIQEYIDFINSKIKQHLLLQY